MTSINSDWTVMDHSEASGSGAQCRTTPIYGSDKTYTINPAILQQNANNNNNNNNTTSNDPATILHESTISIKNPTSPPPNNDDPPRGRTHPRDPDRTLSRSPSPPPNPFARPYVYPSPPTQLTNSTTLLAKIPSYDGLVELPNPSRTSIYLTTYPFTNRDVQKWAWVLRSRISDVWMHETARSTGGVSLEDDGYGGSANRWVQYEYGEGRREHRRSRSPYYDNYIGFRDREVPGLFASRALDPAVISEKDSNVEFLIVVQNGKGGERRAAAFKLLVAESRKAAAVLVFYEMLNGNSVVFVGAVLDGRERFRGVLKRVEGLEGARRWREVEEEEQTVGVVC